MKNKGYTVFIIGDNQNYGLFSDEGFTKKEMKKAAKKGLHHYLVKQLSKHNNTEIFNGITEYSEEAVMANRTIAGEMFTSKPVKYTDTTVTEVCDMLMREFIQDYCVHKHDMTLICAYVENAKYASSDIVSPEGKTAFMDNIQRLVEEKIGKTPEVMIYDHNESKKGHHFHRYTSKNFIHEKFERMMKFVKEGFKFHTEQNENNK